MNNLLNEFLTAVASMQQNVFFCLILVLSLYLIHFLNSVSSFALNQFGLLPRTFRGLFGIFSAPVLHSNFNHLFFNSIPLFILINFVLLYGFHTFYCVTLFIIIVSGVLVWLVGRKALHIGASGLIMGYWSYLLVNAYQQSTMIAIILGLICVYYFGGLLFEIVPLKFEKSWEYHLFGFLSGIASAFVCPHMSNIFSMAFS